MKFRLRNYALAGLALLAMAVIPMLTQEHSVHAQVPSLPPQPYNSPVPNPSATTPTATKLFTNTLQGVATVSSNILNNLAYEGLQCTYNATALSGSPSVTINIQAYDEASATFTTLLTSGTANNTTLNTPTTIQIYPGIQTTSLPSNVTSLSWHMPRFVRVQEIVAGASTATTGSVGCDWLK